VSSSEEDMCTHGGIEPGMCGSRSVSSSSTAADEWRMLLLGGDSLRCAISGIGDAFASKIEKNRRAGVNNEAGGTRLCFGRLLARMVIDVLDVGKSWNIYG
jgi:hypothetical protein